MSHFFTNTKIFKLASVFYANLNISEYCWNISINADGKFECNSILAGICWAKRFSCICEYGAFFNTAFSSITRYWMLDVSKSKR